MGGKVSDGQMAADRSPTIGYPTMRSGPWGIRFISGNGNGATSSRCSAARWRASMMRFSEILQFLV